MSTIKERLGCWAHERWKTELAIRFPGLADSLGLSWPALCNRNERLHKDEPTGAYECRWSDSSILTVGRIFPAMKSRLFTHCFSQWPFRFNYEQQSPSPESPDASILIAVGGSERLPLLQVVLASLRGQVGVGIEIIVVEQCEVSQLRGQLPTDVTHIHCPNPSPELGFNKSHALNVAANHASGDVYFVHDGDYAVPQAYVKESLRLLGSRQGCRPVRWLFYLDQPSTASAVADHRIVDPGIEKVVQNNPTPIVVTADAYHGIGGHDESYFGWGGEDLEFLSRLRLSGREQGGTLPIVHLWHPAAAKKASGDRNQSHHDRVMATSPAARIRQLRGQLSHSACT